MIVSYLKVPDYETQCISNGPLVSTEDGNHTRASSFGMTHTCPQTTGCNDEYPILKALRLVNTMFHELATRALFETLILLRHPRSWKAMDNIALSPRLAPLVKKVQIATNSGLPVVFAPSEKEEPSCHWPPRRYEDLSSEELVQMRPLGGPLACLDQRHDVRVRRYKDWMTGEREMQRHSHDGTAPRLNLHEFTNLNAVQTVTHRELATIKVVLSNENPAERRFPTYVSRREVETWLPDWDSPYSGPGIEEAHLGIFLTAMERSRSRIERLALRSPKVIFDCCHTLEFCALRHLTIQIEEISRLGQVRELSASSWPRYSTQSYLPTLEELEIIGQQSQNYWVDFFFLAQSYNNVHWPKLAHVSFKDTLISFDDVASFIMKHRRSLRKFSAIRTEIVGACVNRLLSFLAEAEIADVSLQGVSQFYNATH